MISPDDTQFAWWSRLRHSGLLLSPVVQIEKYAEAPEEPKWYQPEKLRTAYNRFLATMDRSKDRPQLAQGDILTWVDALLEHYIGHEDQRLARSHSIPESLTAVMRVGSRTETLRPDRILFDEDGKTPRLVVKVDTSPHIGRGKGRTEYARFLELLRGCGHRLGLLTNGLQFRLIYAGLDFESWCEWESERWFEDAEGAEELLGLRQLLYPTQIADSQGEVTGAGLPGLLGAVEESRKRQADLSQVLRENVRQAIELLLEDVSHASRSDGGLFHALVSVPGKDRTAPERQLTDAEAHEALLQATVRIVMRMVVCLFAESRGLLPVNDPIYAQAYGVRTLYELLEETVRHEGSQLGLMTRQSAWARLMALFRLIHGGSSHGGFPLRAYGGALFRPGESDADDPVSRALSILEHQVSVNDATIYRVLKKLLRGPLPVLRGRSKTYVEGPVDYTELRTEFIGLIYEGLLDYRVKRTTEETGPQVFLNLGRQPVLPLSRLESMLVDDPKSLRDLFTKLKKESAAASVASVEETEDAEEDADAVQEPEEPADELPVETEEDEEVTDQTYLDALQATRRWARQAIVATKMVGQQRARETDTEYDKRIEQAIDQLIDRVVAPGEFYLVRAGNTRKGTGTFYTRPQLAVPTVHRTLEPLCYEVLDTSSLAVSNEPSPPPSTTSHLSPTLPKKPEDILALKICDAACGSASFLVAALHYLTDALYKSLCYHCGLDDPRRAAKITLPFGTPATGRDSDATVPLPPDDPNRGEEFAERVQALLRRHVVERCIYGVDINPLAVEFARVSLWVETLDRDLPFSFLDHKIKVGNSLVGCWLDRVEEYPAKAWERQAGDGDKGPETDLIATFLKGEKIGNRRTGDGIVKRELREDLRASRDARSGTRHLFGDAARTIAAVVGQAREHYDALHNIPIHQPGLEEDFYRQHIAGSDAVQSLRRAMDHWCAVWFWPIDALRQDLAPLPLSFLSDDQDAVDTVGATADQIRFFHWELEFPDVFTPERTGFDAVIGNPPWDVMKPNSQEFFSDYDPLYRMYDKQAALRKQRQLFAADPAIERRWLDYNATFRALANWAAHAADPFDVALARGKEGEQLKAAWESRRQTRPGYAAPEHPFRLQGSADVNSYKMFAELFWHLLRPGGRLGAILPTGLYSDFGTRSLREELLFRGQLEFLYAFQNEKRVFSAAHHSFKQAAVFATKGGSTTEFRARFRMGVGDSPQSHEIPDDILGRDGGLTFTPETVRANSPKTLSLVELRTPRDLEIFEKIYANSIRIGDQAPGWEITYAREFDMTNDSKHFPPLEKWERQGYRPDPYGRWIGPDGDVALPLYQGRAIHQFDFWKASWNRGAGATAIWDACPSDAKRIRPMNLMSQATFQSLASDYGSVRVVFRDIARSSDVRSMISCCVPFFPCNNKVPLLRLEKSVGLLPPLLLSSILNCLTFDFAIRTRLISASLNWFLVGECPIPRSISRNDNVFRIVVNAARLTFLHRRFAPEWLKLAHEFPAVFGFDPLAPSTNYQEPVTAWKHWWAVTEADRLRLRVEIDALCADLYGLDPDDFDWIVRDDPKDPKGFYRVDRQLPFRERLTGLSAAAFRALKNGNWSAETAGQLTNDQFFDLLGIPELTNPTAAKAKRLAAPLIQKRDGCHAWHPETFPEDDPRHGWTWHHCHQDALTLLGSEQALHQYIAQTADDTSSSASDDEDATTSDQQPPTKTDLFGDPLPTDLFGNEIRPKKKRRRK